MSTKTKKEKVEFIRGDDFDAVDDELGSAMNALDAANTRIVDLLATEARGDLPGLDSPPVDPPLDAPITAVDEAAVQETPRVRKSRRKGGGDEA